MAQGYGGQLTSCVDKGNLVTGRQRQKSDRIKAYSVKCEILINTMFYGKELEVENWTTDVGFTVYK